MRGSSILLALIVVLYVEVGVRTVPFYLARTAHIRTPPEWLHVVMWVITGPFVMLLTLLTTRSGVYNIVRAATYVCLIMGLYLILSPIIQSVLVKQ